MAFTYIFTLMSLGRSRCFEIIRDAAETKGKSSERQISRVQLCVCVRERQTVPTSHRSKENCPKVCARANISLMTALTGERGSGCVAGASGPLQSALASALVHRCRDRDSAGGAWQRGGAVR